MSVYIFAGGGTGGHLYPGLSVAQELLAIEPQAHLVFACSERAIDKKILESLPYAMAPQPIRPLPHSPGAVWPFITGYLRSRKLAREMLADLKPTAVLGLGGFAAGPMLVQAAKRGVRRGFLNPDAVPGKANQMLARHAELIFTQFESTTQTFPAPLRGKVRCVGCPLRPAFASADRAAGAQLFGLRPDRRTLLIFGGSLLAESISEAIGALAADLAPLAGQWQVLHITGSPKADAIEANLKSAGLHVRTLKYCDRMELAYAAADLVLARGGAGTVAELAVTGRPSVILPYPHHKDQQQKLNAIELEQAHAALVVNDLKDPAANAATLREKMLPILRDPSVLAQMQQSAAGLGKPNAAKTVAQWMVGQG